jgi:hypothetical protein
MPGHVLGRCYAHFGLVTVLRGLGTLHEVMSVKHDRLPEKHVPDVTKDVWTSQDEKMKGQRADLRKKSRQYFGCWLHLRPFASLMSSDFS